VQLLTRPVIRLGCSAEQVALSDMRASEIAGSRRGLLGLVTSPTDGLLMGPPLVSSSNQCKDFRDYTHKVLCQSELLG
jgi:hypothetical protein